MLQVLLPAGAAAGVVLLIGLLIAIGDKPGTGEAEKVVVSGNAPFPTHALEWAPVDEAKYPGLKKWDTKEGSGEPCPKGATVTIHYTGWTTDGTKFDSSKDRGEPATFPLASLIQGWQAGVPGMKPGGVRRLMIPYKFAYGEEGRPPSTPPKATLLFEMELVAVK